MKLVLLSLGLVFATSAHAGECPAQLGETYLDDVVAAIKATTSCDEASTLAKDCALGASGDQPIALAAERVCGRDYWKKLSKPEAGVHNTLQRKCNEKYAGLSGTMYISAKAFCRLHVAELYSELYTSAE